MTILITAIVSFVIGIFAGAIWQQYRAESNYAKQFKEDFYNANSNLK